MRGYMTNTIAPTLDNPFDEEAEIEFTVPGQASYAPGLYEEKLKLGFELRQRPYTAAGETNIFTRTVYSRRRQVRHHPTD